MSRRGGQVEAAVLIVGIAHHGPATATDILFFGNIFVRALWKKAVDGTRAIRTASPIAAKDTILEVYLLHYVLDWRGILYGKV